MTILSFGFLAMFISLIVGLANVIGYIEEAEIMRQSGYCFFETLTICIINFIN